MGNSYFTKVAGFYRCSHWRCSVKESVLRKVFAKFTGKQLCQRLYFNKVCGPKAVKRRLRHKCFPLNLEKFVRTPFLQNTSRWLLLLLAFQKQPQVFYEKRCSWKFCKIYRKTPVVCKIFRNTFLIEHLCNYNFTKRGTANSIWKTSHECSLSRNTNLRSSIQVYHSFLGSINFQWMFSLVYTVYCQKQPPE